MTHKTGPQPDGCRAERLIGPARQVHQAALAAFIRTGQPPARSELEQLARSLGASPEAVLAELAAADVIAFTAGGEIRAACPFSPFRTPVRVSWPGGPPPPGHDHRGRAGHRPRHHRPRRRQPGTLAPAHSRGVRRLGGR
jgi:hypothetical protein